MDVKKHYPIRIRKNSLMQRCNAKKSGHHQAKPECMNVFMQAGNMYRYFHANYQARKEAAVNRREFRFSTGKGRSW
jgi:hypothetical protein